MYGSMTVKREKIKMSLYVARRSCVVNRSGGFMTAFTIRNPKGNGYGNWGTVPNQKGYLVTIFSVQRYLHQHG